MTFQNLKIGCAAIGIIVCILLVGCMTEQQYYERKAGQGIVDALNQYDSAQDILKDYDADCLKNECTKDCVEQRATEIPNKVERMMTCDMQCSGSQMLETNAAKFPECKKGSSVASNRDCPTVFTCKNPITEGGVQRCPESELQDYLARCR